MSSTPEERRRVRPFFFMMLGGLVATVGGIALVILGLVGVLTGGWIAVGIAVAVVGGVLQIVALQLTMRRVPPRPPSAARLRRSYRVFVGFFGAVGIVSIVIGIVIGGTWLWALGLAGLIQIGLAIFWGFKYLGKRSAAILAEEVKLAEPRSARLIVSFILIGVVMIGILLIALSFRDAKPQLLFFLGFVTIMLAVLGLNINRRVDDMIRRRRPTVAGLVVDVLFSCSLVLLSVFVILGGSPVFGALMYLVGAGSAVVTTVLWSRARSARRYHAPADGFETMSGSSRPEEP